MHHQLLGIYYCGLASHRPQVPVQAGTTSRMNHVLSKDAEWRRQAEHEMLKGQVGSSPLEAGAWFSTAKLATS